MENASIQSLKEAVLSARARIAALSERIEKAVKLNTMRELRASAIEDREAKRKELEQVLADKKEAALAKKDALQTIGSAASDEISLFLPYGRAVIKLTEEDRLAIGWQFDSHKETVKWDGLSGGERAAFMVALGCAASAGKSAIVTAEVAEMDYESLGNMMNQLAFNSPDDMQVILSTHLVPVGSRPEWNIVDMTQEMEK